MAIFEKVVHNKHLIDDTEKLSCTLETTQNIDKHTEYILKVLRGPLKENSWNVSHRYKDFAALHNVLQHSGIDLPLPPKKLIGNMQPSFIAERQIALQNYMNEVLRHQILALSFHVRRFLDPRNYTFSHAEQALQTVSIALRGDGKYELKGPLEEIGWRIRKHYFIVKDINSQTNCLLSYQSYGPDRQLCDKDMQSTFKSLLNLTHPYIDPVLAIHNLESGAYVVRRIHEKGSIRDILYGTEYVKNYLVKYGNPKIRKPFTTGQIAHYGYQILEALKFMHSKGLPHGHIHPGNITIENQRAILLDIENSVIGAPSIHRPFLVELKKVYTAEAVDVYCFARTLYEMAYATPMESATCDEFPGISADLESIFRVCLSPEASKHQLPTLDVLMRHPLFSRPLGFTNGHAAAADARPHLKFPATLKLEMAKAFAAIEARLRSDQKLVRNAKREVRIQEILSSEEEMRKHRRKVKKRSSVWKSTPSLADAARSLSASTASSPTPPTLHAHPLPGDRVESASTSTATPVPAPSPAAAAGPRGALLAAICNFDKNRLARVNSDDS